MATLDFVGPVELTATWDTYGEGGVFMKDEFFYGEARRLRRRRRGFLSSVLSVGALHGLVPGRRGEAEASGGRHARGRHRRGRVGPENLPLSRG